MTITGTEMKKSPHGIISKLNTAEEKIGEVEDTKISNKENDIKKNKVETRNFILDKNGQNMKKQLSGQIHVTLKSTEGENIVNRNL